jgi:predicted permease
MADLQGDRLRRWLHLLLKAYPRDFREACGQDLERTYLDWLQALRSRGARFAEVRVLGLAVWHSMRDGLMERVTGGREAREGTMESLTTDIRMAVRGLGKAPGFTAAAVLVLALGVGANVTAFSALRVAMLGRPDYPDVERLVSVDLLRQSSDGTWRSRWAYPYVELLERAEGRLVDPVAAYREFHATLSGLGPASHISIEMVSPDYFRVVGLPLPLGRSFTAQEGRPGAGGRVVVVSHAFWRSRLDGSVAAIGREIRLNGAGFRIVGVAPEGFRGLIGDAELWVPHGSYDLFQPGVLGQVGNHVAWVAGRLAPGATLESAAAQIRAIGEVIGEQWPRNDRYGAGLRSFEELWTNPNARAASLLLSLAAGLVLLVACANLSGLLLARARGRMRAGAVRRALGASRWRLVRGSLMESLIVSALGCVAALAVSSWGTGMLARTWPRDFLRGSETGLQVVDPASMGLGPSSVAFALTVSVVAALLIGILPALRASSEDVTEHLKAATGAVGGEGRVARPDAQSILVGGQVSLALMLVLSVGVLGAPSVSSPSTTVSPPASRGWTWTIPRRGKTTSSSRPSSMTG